MNRCLCFHYLQTSSITFPPSSVKCRSELKAMKSWRMTFFLFLLSTLSVCEWLLGARYFVRATDTLGYTIVRPGVAPIRCCASTPKSRSVKCPQCLKNSLFSVCCFSLNFLSSLNILSVSGSISSPSMCLFRKVFRDVHNSVGRVMIWISFFKSRRPLMCAPSESGLMF